MQIPRLRSHGRPHGSGLKGETWATLRLVTGGESAVSTGARFGVEMAIHLEVEGVEGRALRWVQPGYCGGWLLPGGGVGWVLFGPL